MLGLFPPPPPLLPSHSHQFLSLLRMTEFSKPEKCKWERPLKESARTYPDSMLKPFITVSSFKILAMALPFSLQLLSSPGSSPPSHTWDIFSLLQQNQSQPNSEMQTLGTGQIRSAGKCVFLATVQDGTHLPSILVQIIKDHDPSGFLTSLMILLQTTRGICIELLTFPRRTPKPLSCFPNNRVLPDLEVGWCTGVQTKCPSPCSLALKSSLRHPDGHGGCLKL